MAVPEGLLSDWAKAPGDANAIRAHEQVRTALEKSTVLASRTFDIYLQGSYKNRTHIRADSDVDVVAELKSTFYYDIDDLPQSEKTLFHEAFPYTASYGYSEFRQDVLRSLISSFGERNVDSRGNKCLTVAGNQERSDADVLPCLEHRKYVKFGHSERKFIPGLKFFTQRERKLIINWPKVHFENGSAKNQATGNQFKAMVRIGKHLRNLCVEEKILRDDEVPSYFLECLLYNVPDYYFEKSLQVTSKRVFSYLKSASLDTFWCVNRQDKLFNGENAWNTLDAVHFIELAHATIK